MWTLRAQRGHLIWLLTQIVWRWHIEEGALDETPRADQLMLGAKGRHRFWLYGQILWTLRGGRGIESGFKARTGEILGANEGHWAWFTECLMAVYS